MEEARALYQESTAAAPDIRQTLLGFARLEEADRHFDAAGDVLDSMEQRFPNDPAVRLTRAVLLGRQRNTTRPLALIDSSQSPATPGSAPTNCWRKAVCSIRSGRYDDAWAAFAEGKRLARELSGSVYLDDAAENSRSTACATSSPPAACALIPHAGVRHDMPQPIFILGFPRSGTTLVEQTLSAHPNIAAGDELPLIHDITTIMPRMLASPAGLSRGAGRTVDGRPARGAGQSARLLSAEGRARWACCARARRASPTRCR